MTGLNKTKYWWVRCLRLDCKDYLDSVITKEDFINYLEKHKKAIKKEEDDKN